MFEFIVRFFRDIFARIRRKLLRVKNRLISNYVASKVKQLTLPGAVCEIGMMESPFHGEKGTMLRYYKNIQGTLPEYMDQCSNSDEEFLVYPGKPTDPLVRRLSFKQVHAEADLMREILLNKYAVVKGDRVAILMSNIPEWVTAFMGVTETGAICVTLNAFWEGEEIEFGLNDSGTKVLIADEKRLLRLVPNGRLEKLIKNGLRVICVNQSEDIVKLSQGTIASFHELINSQKGQPITSPRVDLTKVKTHDDCIIMYTSGTTTGRPKGVVLTHFNITQTLASYQLFLELMKVIRGGNQHKRADLLTVPLFHASGLVAALLLAYKDLHKVVFIPKWDADYALELCLKEKVTFFGAMPTMLSDVLKSKVFLEHLDEFSFTNIGTGGAATPSDLIHRTARALPKISQGSGWGMTESCSMGTVVGGPEYLEFPNSCGKAHAIVDLKLVDRETGEEIREDDKPGEILIRSPTNMRCYWNLPEATKEIMTKDGYMRTGDVATRNADGFIFIVDRIKDLVIRGGENISCSEVEDVVYSLPGDVIFEASAFGLPDERLGEILCVAVFCQPGKSCTEQQVKAYCESRLAKFKVPERVIVRAQPLPRGGTGKILKRVLKEEYKQ